MRKTLMLFMMLSLAACAATRPIVTIPPASCAKIIPQSWKGGVEAAPVPVNTDLAGMLGLPLTKEIAAKIVSPWAQGYVGQDGALSKANGRTADAISIFENCEAMVNDARPK